MTTADRGEQNRKLAERLKVIESHERSGSYFDGQGDYIHGVIDALRFAIGKNSDVMPWMKKRKNKGESHE